MVQLKFKNLLMLYNDGHSLYTSVENPTTKIIRVHCNAMHCHHYLATHSALLLGRPDKLCFMQFPRNWGNARPGFSILKVIFFKFVLVLLSTINCKGIQSNDFCWKVRRIKILILHFEPFSLCKVFEIEIKRRAH